MSNLVSFAFEDNLVRSRLDENGEPWFVAKDVALALGHQWNGSARIAHVPEEWKLVTSVVTSFGEKQTWFLSEPGLYFFVARSDKPRALPFQKWLAGEVLPALRKSGHYETPGYRERMEQYSTASFTQPEAARYLRPAMRRTSALQRHPDGQDVRQHRPRLRGRPVCPILRHGGRKRAIPCRPQRFAGNAPAS